MLKNYLHQLFRSKGIQQVLIMVVGNSMATGISAISLILISRLLGPSLFGEFSVGFALIMIIVRINDAGLTAALTKFAGQTTNHDKQNDYFSVTLKTRLLFSLLIVTIGLLSLPILKNILQLEHSLIIIFSIIFGMATVYMEQLTAMLQSLHRFTQAVTTNFLQASVKIVSAITFTVLSVKNVTLVFGVYALAPILPLLLSPWLLPQKTTLNLREISKDAKDDIYQMIKHTGIANISTTIVGQSNILFVQAFLSSYETGILGGVAKIHLLFSLIAASLGNVLFPRVSRYKAKQDLQMYLIKAFGVILLALIGLGVSLTLAKHMIIFTVGNEYLPGLNVLYVLLAAIFTMIATVPFTALFYTFDRHIFFSVTGALQVLLIVGGNLLLIPMFGLIGTAYAQLTTRFILFAVTVFWGLIVYRNQFNNTSTNYLSFLTIKKDS